MRAKSLLISLFSFLLLILLPAVTIYAGDVFDFGPQNYTREKSKPVTITDTFSAYDGPGTLKVTTNALETSGKITFNGQVLLMQGDFKEQITYYEKEVSLHQDNNTIEVYDESKPGAWMQVEVTHQDSPATFAYIGSSGGTITEPGGASISIPPGALTEERWISIMTHHSAASLPAPAPLVGGVNMGPDGLVFQLPVTITIPLNTGFTEGAELPVFLYDSQKNGWVYTGIFASVNPDGVSASYNVTHFTDYIVMGVSETDAAKYFGAFEAKIFDICHPTLTVDLYHELQDLWTSKYFPIGDKHIWSAFPNRDYACYEVAGIRFSLVTSREKPGDKKGEWVNIESGYYDYTIGYEGPIALVFLNISDHRIAHSKCGEQQITYFWDIYVYLRCASPDINLEAISNYIHPKEQTGVWARLMCGDEPMVNQKIDFTLDGPGHFDEEPAVKYTSQGGSANISLTADDVGTINVYGEYESCLGQEQPWNPLVFGMSTINVEGLSVKVEADKETIQVGETTGLTVTVYDEHGEIIPEGCPSENFTWTIPEDIIGINFDPLGVTGVSEGTATITYTCEEASGSATIQVGPQECNSVEIKPSTAKILIDEPKTLDVTVKDKYGNIIPDPDLDWTIPSGGIISFDYQNYIVTGKDVGTATITATCGAASSSANIEVTDKALFRLVWNYTWHSTDPGWYIDFNHYKSGDITIELTYDSWFKEWGYNPNFNDNYIVINSLEGGNDYGPGECIWKTITVTSWDLEHGQSEFYEIITKAPLGGWLFHFPFRDFNSYIKTTYAEWIDSVWDPVNYNYIECVYGNQVCNEDIWGDDCRMFEPNCDGAPRFPRCDDFYNIYSETDGQFEYHWLYEYETGYVTKWDIIFTRVPFVAP